MVGLDEPNDMGNAVVMGGDGGGSGGAYRGDRCDEPTTALLADATPVSRDDFRCVDPAMGMGMGVSTGFVIAWRGDGGGDDCHWYSKNESGMAEWGIGGIVDIGHVALGGIGVAFGVARGGIYDDRHSVFMGGATVKSMDRLIKQVRAVLMANRQWVWVLIGILQLGVLLGYMGVGEWVLRRGMVVTLSVDPLTPYQPVKGQKMEFLLSIFQHSFSYNEPLQVGDWVVVQAVDPLFRSWGIRAKPLPGLPYFKCAIQSTNQGYYFISPPFRDIRLSPADAKWVRGCFDRGARGNKPNKVSLQVQVRQSNATWVLEGLWVEGRFLRRY